MTTLSQVTKTLIAGNAALICASQTPGAAGAMTLVASPVTLDTQRQVLITCAGNNAGVTFTLTGTKDTGQTISEIIAGSNAGTSVSLWSYRTITSIVISGASTGAVTVGTNTTGSSDWKNVDSIKDGAFGMSIACTVTGTVTYSIEVTNGSYLRGTAPTPFATSIAAAVANQMLNLTAPIHAWRLTVTAGIGSVLAEAIEQGRK
jgi:hypothetical protein